MTKTTSTTAANPLQQWIIEPLRLSPLTTPWWGVDLIDPYPYPYLPDKVKWHEMLTFTNINNSEYQQLRTAEYSNENGDKVFELEVPGYKKEDININVSKNTLTVNGTAETVSKKDAWKTGLTRNGFVYTFTLPDNFDVSNIVASYENGILRVTVPVLAVSESKEHKIVIQ